MHRIDASEEPGGAALADVNLQYLFILGLEGVITFTAAAVIEM
jgi:hypothetical protein